MLFQHMADRYTLPLADQFGTPLWLNSCAHPLMGSDATSRQADLLALESLA